MSEATARPIEQAREHLGTAKAKVVLDKKDEALQHIALALAALSRLEAEGWQPMHTAPVDGTWVLLWWPHWHHVPMIGYYDNYGWRCDRALSEDGIGPLAWHSLPAPPKPEEQQP